MKLWIKLSLVISLVITVLISIAMGVIFNLQVNFIRETQEQNAISSLSSCVKSAEASCAAQLDGNYSDTVLTALVTYVFREYTKILQDEQSSFVLCQQDYLYNPNGAEPAELFDEINSEVQLLRTTDTLFLAQKFEVGNVTFRAFLCVDNRATNARIARMLQTSIGTCLIILILLILTTMVIVKKSLQPVETLTKTAHEIANGNYQLRTDHHSRDEIGELSCSFDSMASAIQDQINHLQQEVEKRELFVGALTHEIKTPLTAIVGFSDTVLHQKLNETQKMTCIQNISTAGQYANSISLKLLELMALTQREEIRFLAVDTKRLTDGIDLPVIFHLHSDHIKGDETLLHSLLYNLCSNGLKYSSVVNAHLYVDKLVVTDQGNGIEPDKIPLLTEAFYRVDKARSRADGGMGLGLTICKKICQLHGGTLVIQSELGKGTTVTAKLQLDDNLQTS